MKSNILLSRDAPILAFSVLGDTNTNAYYLIRPLHINNTKLHTYTTGISATAPAPILQVRVLAPITDPGIGSIPDIAFITLSTYRCCHFEKVYLHISQCTFTWTRFPLAASCVYIRTCTVSPPVGRQWIVTLSESFLRPHTAGHAARAPVGPV